MDFDPNYDAGERENLIKAVQNNYDQVFESLYPFIAYGSSGNTANFRVLEAELRSIIENCQDDVQKFTSEISDRKTEVETDVKEMVENIRATSAEAGVSQHAVHFQKESDSHQKQSQKWKWATIVCTVFLGLYSVAAIGLYDWFTPGDIKHEIQLSVGKILLFAVFSYGVFFVDTKFYVSYSQCHCQQAQTKCLDDF